MRDTGGGNSGQPRSGVNSHTHFIDGVTRRQPTVVAGVAVPHSDDVEKGIGLSLLQASARDDHELLCRNRRVIGTVKRVRIIITVIAIVAVSRLD